MNPEEAFDRLRAYREQCYGPYAAFFSGSRERLRRAAGGDLFWGSGRGRRKLHVPVAGDIAAASADLLFSEPPRFTALNKEGGEAGEGPQRRLDALTVATGLLGKLCEAAESCAALGDVYLKLGWDRALAEHPLISVVQADCAWPEAVGDCLAGLHVFTEQGESRGEGRLRLWEYHGPGLLRMGLYLGDGERLGRPLPESALHALGYRAEQATGLSRLLAVHVPNLRPNRASRDPFFGRSDLEGSLPLLDALDEAWSSWMRDLRLGRARLIVAREYLRRMPSHYQEGADRGAFYFDEDEEVVCSLEIDPGAGGSRGIENTQFAIRAEEHSLTCRELLERVVAGAGYSPQTFGLRVEGRLESGIALRLREKKTFATRGKKENYWRPALQTLLTALVRLDARLCPGQGSLSEGRVGVEFADGVADDLSTMSVAARNLAAARAASRRTLVGMLHPDWSRERVLKEAEAIGEQEINRETNLEKEEA